ncbi:DNA repair protein RecN [Agrilactobacillus fermenti]|uniref:DNA repair protein RecN n=1 Tax=Agrilactobacillus fermenti TaxID=2586909 RepID=UPI001E374C26|nr:DNA repair protein RecN [Agrilactobacillus fermenti]MCD2256213.1 DNA repair protein RecN [Agrilactobacillus fermenti]
MLQELVIHDFAIIDKLSIEFQPGMTVLTGETGAGKSIIIDAVGLLAGGRGSTDFIRAGANKCTLEGLFILDEPEVLNPLLDQYGIDQDNDTILLQREINQHGRSICRINGHLVNLTILKAIGEHLVDIHGQNEHQELMFPEKHLGLLDQFAKPVIQDTRLAYQQAFEQYKKLYQSLQQRRNHEQEWAQRLDMLQYQSTEINGAQLKLGEDDALSQEKERLENFQKINENLGLAYQTLTGVEPNALDQIGQAMTALADIAELDPVYQKISDAVNSAFYELQDTSSELSRQIDNLSWDEGRLDEIDNRLEVINELKRKYGESIESILQYQTKIDAELEKMNQSDTDFESLEADVQRAKKRLLQLGQELSNRRKKAAQTLTLKIQSELSDLYMDKAKFSVRFKQNEQQLKFFKDGIDDVEFYIQTNPGEGSKPLAKIASGGELSRIMLALKTIFSHAQGITSIIFDEVDTGVSGRVAQAIANKIAVIAANSQVLCISHLPQVAAMADIQLLIQKKITANRTKTSVNHLAEKQRVSEIARMITGTEITTLALEHAQELLQLAEDQKAALMKA